MRILVLGAGAIGGYFGARLVQAGSDVTFLVRERRAGQLRARGVVVRSPHGDFSVPARAVVRAADAGAADLVIVAWTTTSPSRSTSSAWRARSPTSSSCSGSRSTSARARRRRPGPCRYERSSSLMLVRERVRASTFLMITAQAVL